MPRWRVGTDGSPASVTRSTPAVNRSPAVLMPDETVDLSTRVDALEAPITHVDPMTDAMTAIRGRYGDHRRGRRPVEFRLRIAEHLDENAPAP